MVMVDGNIAESSVHQEYDTGEDPFGNLFNVEVEVEAVSDQLNVYGQVEFLEIEQANGVGTTSSATVKDEGPYNLQMMRTSLDNDTNNDSDCIITAAYITYDAPEDECDGTNEN